MLKLLQKQPKTRIKKNKRKGGIFKEKGKKKKQEVNRLYGRCSFCSWFWNDLGEGLLERRFAQCTNRLILSFFNGCKPLPISRFSNILTVNCHENKNACDRRPTLKTAKVWQTLLGRSLFLVFPFFFVYVFVWFSFFCFVFFFYWHCLRFSSHSSTKLSKF